MFFVLHPPVLFCRKIPICFTRENLVSVSQVDEIMIIRAIYATKQVWFASECLKHVSEGIYTPEYDQMSQGSFASKKTLLCTFCFILSGWVFVA